MEAPRILRVKAESAEQAPEQEQRIAEIVVERLVTALEGQAGMTGAMTVRE